MDLILKEPKLKIELPEIGERFKYRHLPPISRRLYKALARISEMPVNELLPIRIPHEQNTIHTGGESKEDTHGVALRTPIYYAPYEEEFLHSLQEFLPRPIIVRTEVNGKVEVKIVGHKKASNLGFTEPAAKIYMQSIHPYNAFAYHNEDFPDPAEKHLPPEKRGKYEIEPLFEHISPEVDEKILRTRPRLVRDFQREMNIRISIARNYYNRHKEYGYLLLFASPPDDLIDLDKWEKKRIKTGILTAKGGITEKGMRLLKRIYSKKNILATFERHINPNRRELLGHL